MGKHRVLVIVVPDRTIDLRKAENMNLKDAAEFYLNQGIDIVPLNVREKSTYEQGWNKPEFVSTITWWELNPERNIGFFLGRNHILSLDLDWTDAFKKSMEAIWPKLQERSKVDTPFWRSGTAGISSGREGSAKLLFAEPEPCPPLVQRALSWVDTTGKNKNGKKCVFELRCGALQDVVPPSIHPDTQKPYKWVVGSENDFVIAEAPNDLMCLWVYWDEFIEDMMKADENYVEPAKPKRSAYSKRYNKESSFTDIADAWSMHRDLVSDLTSYDYSILPNSKRVIYDYSHTHTPGVVVYPGCPDKFISYHSGDFFYCSKDSGRKHIYSAFDLMCHYECNDDKAKAIKIAKEDLGIND